MKLNITKEGIAKVNEARNSVLNAMGFDNEETIEVSEIVETTETSDFGEVVYDEIATNVYAVSYQNQSLYLETLRISPEKFVGN